MGTRTTRTTETRTTTTTETRTTTTTGAEAEAATASGASPSPSAGRRELAAAGSLIGDLFAEHGPMVLGLCRLLLRDLVEAEDAAQQVFLSAHHAILRGAHPRDPPVWLAAIARNECRARIGARMREPLELPELPSDLPDPLAAAIRAVDLEAFWTALSALPRRQRRALVLRELGGLSYHELGRALGVSHSAVESLLFRARQQLRSILASATAAAAPLAVRDELARLIPGFDPASAGLVARIAALPVAMKLATAAVGVGVIATGAGQSGEQRAHPDRPHAPPSTPAATQPAPARARSQLLAERIAQRSSPLRGHTTLRTRASTERNGDQSDGDPIEAEQARSAHRGAEVEVRRAEPDREPPAADTESDSSGPGSQARQSVGDQVDSGSGSDHSGPSGSDPNPGDH